MNKFQDSQIATSELPARLRHLLIKNGICKISDLKLALENHKLDEIYQIGEKSIEHLKLFIRLSSDADDSLMQTPFPCVSGNSSKDSLNFNRTSIEELSFPVRVLNALRRSGVKTLGELQARYSQGSLQGTRFIGPKSLEVIVHTLEEIHIDQTKFLPSKKPEIANWANLVGPFFLQSDERSIYILIKRYGYEIQTLEELARELGITRERVRQIQQRIARNFIYFTRGIHTKQFIAEINSIINDLDHVSSRSDLEKKLNDKGILGGFGEEVKCKYLSEINVMETFFCWLKITSNSGYAKENQRIDLDIRSLQKSKLISLENKRILDEIPLEKKRKIRQIVIYRGGIELQQAMSMLKVSKELALEVLEEQDLNEIGRGWFSLRSIKPEKRNFPLKFAGLKMLAVTNELDFDLFYDGLCKHSSRYFESIAPPDIISCVIKKMGFEIENHIVTTKLSTFGVLAESEKCFINIVRGNGNVASFLEIAEGFFANNLSLPSVSKVTGTSPIVEKVDNGFYKLRGWDISWEEIEEAHKRQKKITQNEEISYGLDGVLGVKITLTSYSYLTGVFYANRFKDLSGQWKVIHKSGSISHAKMDGSFIWGLSACLEELKVKIGDRIELAFNTWNRTLSLEKV